MPIRPVPPSLSGMLPIRIVLDMVIPRFQSAIEQYRSQSPVEVVNDAERLLASLRRWRQTL